MSRCTIDHSREDVLKKYEENSSLFCFKFNDHFLSYMDNELSQEKLNDLFHLFKKIDLLSPKELVERKKLLKAEIGLEEDAC